MSELVGYLSGGLGLRFDDGPWVLAGTAAPGSDDRATAAPYGSLYLRSNTSSSAVLKKTSDVGGTTWVDLSDSGLSAIADDRVLANISGSSAAPTATTLTALFDAVFGTTDDKIIKRVSGTWQAADDEDSGGGGGGGNSTESTAFGSESLTADGDLNLANNAPYISRYTGSAWQPWGPAWPLGRLVSGDFSWVNQSTATLVTTNGVHVLTGAYPAAAAINWNMRVKTAPTPPYTLTVLLSVQVPNAQFGLAGIGWRSSGDSKITSLHLDKGGAFGVTKWTNETTHSANYTLPWAYAPVIGMASHVFVRLKDDNTNRYAQWSHDGFTWYDLIIPVSRTDFHTPDQLFFGANDQQSTYPDRHATISLFSWKEGS